MREVYHVTQLPLFAPTRMCVRCQTEKFVTDFSKSATSSSGYQTYCKECMYFTYSKVKDPTKRKSFKKGAVTSHVCPRCYIEKPLSDFYKSGIEKRGFKGACKDCMDASDTRRKRPGIRRERREKVVAAGNKWCVGCKSEQPLERFTTDRDKDDGRSTLCYSCRNAYHRAYYQALDDEKRAALNTYALTWQKSHPLQTQERHMRRHARKKAVTVEKVSYASILERDGAFCYICEQSILPGQSIDFDHVIPLARGGMHSASNIKPSHAACNRRKGSKLLEEMTPFQRRGIL